MSGRGLIPCVIYIIFIIILVLFFVFHTKHGFSGNWGAYWFAIVSRKGDCQ